MLPDLIIHMLKLYTYIIVPTSWCRLPAQTTFTRRSDHHSISLIWTLMTRHSTTDAQKLIHPYLGKYDQPGVRSTQFKPKLVHTSTCVLMRTQNAACTVVAAMAVNGIWVADCNRECIGMRACTAGHRVSWTPCPPRAFQKLSVGAAAGRAAPSRRNNNLQAQTTT